MKLQCTLIVIRSSNVFRSLWSSFYVCIELCVYNGRRSGWPTIKCTSRLEGNYEDSNCMNLNRVSNNKHCKYHCVVLSSFGKTDQLTLCYLFRSQYVLTIIINKIVFQLYLGTLPWNPSTVAQCQGLPMWASSHLGRTCPRDVH